MPDHLPKPRRSRLFTPLASLALGALLLADAATISDRTALGARAASLLRIEPPHCHSNPPPRALLVREDDDLRLAAWDDPEWRAFRAAGRDTTRHAAILRAASGDVEPLGLWAVTGARMDHTLSVVHIADDLTDDEIASARAMFAGLALADGMAPRHAELLAIGDGVTTDAIPLGYAHNAGVLLAALLFLASFRWVVV